MRVSVSEPGSWQHDLKREALLLLMLVAAGALLLPVAVWFVGQAVFGAYADGGFGSFYAALFARFAAGERSAWFLVLSPYLGVQTLRAMLLAWRLTARRGA